MGLSSVHRAKEGMVIVMPTPGGSHIGLSKSLEDSQVKFSAISQTNKQEGAWGSVTQLLETGAETEQMPEAGKQSKQENEGVLLKEHSSKSKSSEKN